jgi:ankyrin repeat protein
MFENILGDNPILVIIILVVVFSGIVGAVRFIVLAARAGVDRATRTPLMEAIGKGDVQGCMKLLDEGADIGETTKVGNTPLIVACHNGNPEIVELLLSRGARITQLGEYGQTPLMNAIFSKTDSVMRIVKRLVEGGADIDPADKKGTTALCYAVVYNNMEAFDFLLEKGAKPDNSAFITAVSNGTTEMVTKLLERGADPNIRLSQGMGINTLLTGDQKSALRLAVEAENVELVKTLIDHGADIYSEDSGGLDIFTYAAKNFAYRNKPIKALLKEAASKIEEQQGAMKSE